MEQRIDFANSSLTWLTRAEESYGRFAVESVCTVRDRVHNIERTYCLGAAVLAGHVYGPDALVLKPQYLFQIVASETHHSIFRSYARHKRDRDSSGGNAAIFKRMDVRVIKEPADILGGYSEIESHFERHSRLSARVNIAHSEGVVSEIEFPVKHINVQKARNLFQVETGPILFPCVGAKGIDVNTLHFREAFVHFSRLNFIEVTLKVPTRVDFRATRFYSKTLRLEADVKILAQAEN